MGPWLWLMGPPPTQFSSRPSIHMCRQATLPQPATRIFLFRPSSHKLELGGRVALGVREVPVDRLVDRCEDLADRPVGRFRRIADVKGELHHGVFRLAATDRHGILLVSVAGQLEARRVIPQSGTPVRSTFSWQPHGRGEGDLSSCAWSVGAVTGGRKVTFEPRLSFLSEWIWEITGLDSQVFRLITFRSSC